MSRIITLLTDFGLHDEYVGVMKGAILCRCPEATLVDLCHHIPAQDIAAAARMLEASFSSFPSQTIHLVVVDPGVGTERSIIVASHADHLFIGPDNGILSFALRNEATRCYRLSSTLDEGQISATFHGRDIMGPLAGLLAQDRTRLQQYCRPIQAPECTVIEPDRVKATGKGVMGEVTAIDHFGNITTSIGERDLHHLTPPLRFSLAGREIRGLCRTYDDVKPGELVALVGSRGFLEIGANQGNAAQLLNVAAGTVIEASGTSD